MFNPMTVLVAITAVSRRTRNDRADGVKPISLVPELM